MEATKSANPANPSSSAPRRPASVALDFLMLAGVSIIAGLITAAVAAAFVILLSGQPDPAADAPQAPASAVTATVKMNSAPQ